MPRKIVTETMVYKFEELSDKAKEKARDWFRELSNDDTFWQESVYDDAATCGAFLGIDLRTRTRKARNGELICGEPNIYYSGFWSQGDGACFEGNWSALRINVAGLKEHAPKDSELHRIVDALAVIAAAYPEAIAHTKQSGHYYHSGCMDVTSDSGICSYEHDSEELSEQAMKLEKAFPEDDLIQLLRDFADWIYRQLEKEYDYQNSDEQVDETICINEYTFTEDGKRFG